MPKLFHTLCCCIRPSSYKKSDGKCDNAGGGVAASSIITQVSKGQQPPTVPGQQLPNAKQRHNAALAAAGHNQQLVGGRAVYSTPPPPTSNDHLINYSSPLTKNKNYFRKDFLLPRPHTNDHHKKCLIVDLDETLVHSSFKYADPVADLLDKRSIFRSRLFREACVFFEGNYVKDLDRLGRELEKVVIIDNSPASYAFHPDNAIPVRTWFDDPHDCELLELIPLLEELAHPEKNIYSVLGTCPPAVRQQQQQQPISPQSNNNNNGNTYLSAPQSSSEPAEVTGSSASTITSATPSNTAANRRNQQEKGLR